jgi:hypothetical protein
LKSVPSRVRAGVRADAGAGPRSAGGPPSGGRHPATTALQRLLEELGAAKRRLLDETAALREVDRRVGAWDLRQAFQARRGHALHTEAAGRFADALDLLEGLLLRLSHDDLGAALRAQHRGPRARRLLVEICSELRYLQRAFDGGNLLLASALATFAAQPL